ncbi:MAG: hypothetical protein HQK61_12040 [Desulfamplus sp.]|nr:hypothetical protein [Desulfamplus sp.]
MQNTKDQTGEKNRAGKNQEDNGNKGQGNLFMRFLNWIARGSEKVTKKGGGCCS